MENPCKIVLFGDSLTVRYAPIFEAMFKEKLPSVELHLINAGISGETSRDALRRLPDLVAEKPNVAVICFGMNDYGKPDLHKGTIDDFRANLVTMVNAFQNVGTRVLLLTTNPVAGDIGSAANRKLAEYNDVIRWVALELKVRLVDIHKAWIETFQPIRKGLEVDIHPNPAGCRLYAKELLKHIRRPNRIILWQFNGNPCECNYKCPYCQYAVQKGHYFTGTIEGWRETFKKNFGREHLAFYLAHGEPMAGEMFYPVLEMIGQEPNWEVRMTSNISAPLERLVETEVARTGRLNINASFHPYMVDKERFLEQLLFLRKHGIESPVVYVLYPPLFRRFQEDFDFFNRQNFLVHVRRFRGKFRGKMYPEAYTDEEMQFIARYCDDATIRYQLFNEPSYAKPSWTGVDFFIVDNKGNVGYCDDFPGARLGNLFDGTFKPFAEPTPFPGKGCSDGTVDGVANFVELDYDQLTGNNVLNYSKQGGVFHTPNGIHYKNLERDFNDSFTRAQYHFPARNWRDAVAILVRRGEPLKRRLERLASSALPDEFNYRNPPTLKSFARSCFKRIPGLSYVHARCVALTRNMKLALRALGSLFLAHLRGVPGLKFHLFSWRCACRHVLRMNRKGVAALLFDPVPLMRYPEYDFAWRCIKGRDIGSFLDVSSPRLWIAFVINKFKRVRATICDPDKRDLTATDHFLKFIGLYRGDQVSFHCVKGDAMPPGTYDVVSSISVVEHVAEDEVDGFLGELWHRVKPGGCFILTVPCACAHRIEYRDSDIYNVGLERNLDGKVFFQRVYDDATLSEKIITLLNNMGATLGAQEIWGLCGGLSFERYLDDVKRRGLRATVSSAHHAAKYIRKYKQTMEMPDRGVWCGCFIK
jgi:acyl-CoA thioesterase-1